jgi:predicted house-cleaning noncanonical NTP pyrophosphatase (MazG superfamily)
MEVKSMDIGNTVTDVARRLEKVFLPISKQYELNEESARKLMREVAEGLLLAQEEERAAFERLAVSVADDVDALEKDWDDETARKQHFASFQKKAIALVNTPPHSNPQKDELAVLLSTIARRIKAEEITKEQIEAIKLVVKYLGSFAISFKDVIFCTRTLRDAGIEPMLQLGKSIDKYLSLLEERNGYEQD